MPHTAFGSSFMLPTLDPQQMPAPLPEMLCDSDVPLLLLPVRLETRFVEQPAGEYELRVRVYPDSVHLDSHETELTRAEHDWGVHFWEQDWRAGDDTDRRMAVWRQLADRFGAARAAWIARALRPLNTAQRPHTTVEATATLAVTPVFGPLTPVDDESAWRRAPVAQLLPDRWIAVAQCTGPGAGGATRRHLAAAGRDIVSPLAVGPDPTTPEDPDIPDDELAIDDDMTWMVDFKEAEDRGMALRLTIPPDINTAGGIEALHVFGVATGLDPDDASTAIAQLIDAHHYTDGLDILRFGTPSNNTAELRAGYASRDPGHQDSFTAEIASDPTTLDVASNAMRLGAAFGLTPEQARTVMGGLHRAASSNEDDGRAMNTALWQVGWGYFLSNMIGMDGTGLTAEGLDWARNYFVSHVRSAGPYPALRCGRQPYGVLPVTSLHGWVSGPAGDATGRDIWLRDLLVNVRDDVWRRHLPDAARLGRRQNPTDPTDPDRDLADIMRREGVSTGYRTRAALGRHYLQHLRAFLGEDLQASLRGLPPDADFLAVNDQLTAGDIITQLGFTWRPRLSRTLYADLPWPITAPLVQAGGVSPDTRLDPNYITALLDMPTIKALIDAAPDPAAPEPTPLLRVLLRHALLRAYADAAAHIAAQPPDRELERLLRDEELVDLVTGAAPTMTWSQQLDLVIPAVTGTEKVRDFLQTTATFAQPGLGALGECRAALTHLSELDTEALQLLMQGTLDLSAYRLDAWITSFATRRLADMRTDQPLGLRVGGYGWVENLTPAGPLGPPVTPPPAGEDDPADGPLHAPSTDTGFIHAPSLTQAATAALLRNAHLGPNDIPQPNGPFAIDLSSRRAREAEQLLDGMRQQQPIGALLGYRFERRLHELGVDALIKPLRELAPLTARKLEDTSLSVEAIAANNVVDGDALWRLWSTDKAQVTVRLREAIVAVNLQSANPFDELTTQRAIVGELDALGETIDAVSDALTAEAAYQIVRANTSRTASTFRALADGDAPPPELEVTRTPRTGIPITHRVVVLLDPEPAPPAGWAGTGRPRAAAEPVLNAWAARLLGDPRNVRCMVEHLDPGGTVLDSRTIRLAELNLAPLDVVYGAGTTAIAAEDGSTLTDIEQRVLYESRRAPGGFGLDAPLRLRHAPDTLGADEVTLFEVLEQARAVRALFDVARAAHPDDLVAPEQPNVGAIAHREFIDRVGDTEIGFHAAHSALSDLVETGTPPQPERLREALLALNGFGVEHSVPVNAAGDDEMAMTALLQQAHTVLLESGRRINELHKLGATPPDDNTPLPQLLNRVQAVFGAAFLALPTFTNDDTAAKDLSNALAANLAAPDDDPLAGHTWFIRAERVRDNLARLADPLHGAEILDTGERFTPRIAQLPFDGDEARWVGLPPRQDEKLPAGKLSLVVQADTTLNPAAPMAGLWVDEWVEVVPSREETTGIAFQYNPPDTCAPQSMLIAVPPDPAEPWTVAGLYLVLAETLDLAKLRAVDMESLTETAHYLPALFLGFNAENEAVSSDLSPLTTEDAG